MGEIRKLKSIISINMYIFVCSIIFAIFIGIVLFLAVFLYDELDSIKDLIEDSPEQFWKIIGDKYTIHIITLSVSSLLLFFGFIGVIISWVTSIIKVIKLNDDNQYRKAHIITSILNIVFIFNIISSLINIILAKKKITEIKNYLEETK